VEFEHQIFFLGNILRVATAFAGDSRVRRLEGGLHLPRCVATSQIRDLLEQPLVIAPPHRRPVNLHLFVVKQLLDHGDIDAVQDFVVAGAPIVQEVVDDFCAEFEGGVMECYWNVFNHVAVGEGDGTGA